MNRKFFLITVLIAVLATFTVVGVVAAQTVTPPAPPSGNGPMGNGSGMMRGGQMHGYAATNGTGPMHEAMMNALAEGLGISRTDLDSRIANGETPYQIALALGFTPTEFRALMVTARQTAFAQTSADGSIIPGYMARMGNHQGQNGGQCPFTTTP